MGLIGGVVAAGTGGNPAAQGGKLEALREVAQGVAVGPKLLLQGGAVYAGLDSGGPGYVVYLQHLVQPTQVDRYDAVVSFGRLHAADHGTTAAVGDNSVAPSGAPVQQGRHLVFIVGVGYHVGRVGELEVEGANSVFEVAAVGVDGPVVGVGGADGGQGIGDINAGRAQVQVVAGRHGRDVYGDAVLGGQGGSQLPALGLGGFVGLHTPGPETSPWHRIPPCPGAVIAGKHGDCGRLQDGGYDTPAPDAGQGGHLQRRWDG